MFASGLAATAAVMIASIGAPSGTPTSHRINRVLRMWGRAWLVPAGVRLEIQGLENVAQGQQYVVASNHLSNLDPMVMLASLPIPLRFLAMRELFDVPVLGQALRRIGMIEIDRASPDGTTIARGVQQALRDEASIFVFPEGQTSHDGSLSRFRIGAFTIAIEHGIPILPVAVIGTRGIWPPGSNTIHSGVVRLIIQEPVHTGGMTSGDAVLLRDRIRLSIESACSASGSD